MGCFGCCVYVTVVYEVCLCVCGDPRKNSQCFACAHGDPSKERKKGGRLGKVTLGKQGL